MRIVFATLAFSLSLGGMAHAEMLSGGCRDTIVAASLSFPPPQIEGPRLEQKPELRLVGRDSAVDPANDPFSIDRLWAEFEGRDHWITNLKSKDGYGVCYGGDSLRYLAGMEVEGDGTIPEGFVTATVSAASYAVFTVTGPAQATTLARQAIHAELLAAAGLQRTDGPEIESFGEHYNPASKTAVMEIWVPIAAR